MASEKNPSPETFDICSEDSNSRSSMHENCSQQDMFEEESVKQKSNNKKGKAKSQPRFVPGISVSEKIVFCIDCSCEKGLNYPLPGDENGIKPPLVVNEVIKTYIINKLAIAKDTQFALASLDSGKVNWLSLLSSNVGNLTKALSSCEKWQSQPDEEVSEVDITPLFGNVVSLINVPEQPKSKVLPPDYVIRIIFVYNNSYASPQVNLTDKSFIQLLNSPYCVTDVLYLHEPKSDFNNVEKVYQDLCKLLCHRSYILECSRDITKVFNSMAKLMAHPYQRVIQDEWEF